MSSLEVFSPDDKVLETKSDFSAVFAILRFGREELWKLIASLCLIVASSATVMGSAWILGQLAEKLTMTPIPTTELYRLGAIFIALEAVFIGLQYYGRLGLASATLAIAFRIRRLLFEKLNRLPIMYFDVQPLGRTITRLTNDVEGMETFFSGTLSRVVVSGIHVVAVLVAMVATDLTFGLMIVVSCLPALLFTVLLRQPIRQWLRAYRKRSAHLNAKLAEYLNGIPVIRIFGLEEWTHNYFREAAGSLLTAGLKMTHWNSFIRPATVFLCSIPTFLILWVGGEWVLEGAMSVGLLVTFVRYSERFISPIRTISQEIMHIQEALVSSERVRQMLQEQEELDRLGPDGSHAAKIDGKVAFANVGMAYKDNQPVLRGVSFVAERGMKIGLVGSTGSGKTSTVNLIPRLYRYQTGNIAIDDVAIEDWKRDAIREQLGYVSQDVVVFYGTVRENLLAALPGNSGTSDAVLRAACHKTGLDLILSRFPQGFDHVVLDGGSNLSMGERQLIAFTRMLLKDPAILILDEATANIDEACERLIQRAIVEVMEGRTCFVIAHRLSTILQCDRILVFAQGKIVEQGTHLELMALGGIYANLARQQIKGH